MNGVLNKRMINSAGNANYADSDFSHFNVTRHASNNIDAM